MKINNTNNASVNATNAGGVRGTDKNADVKGKSVRGDAVSKDVGGSGTTGSARIDMSPNAMAMQKAKSIASKDTIDEAKVARLQKMIDEGNYKVDAEAIADRLVDEHLAIGE